MSFHFSFTRLCLSSKLLVYMWIEQNQWCSFTLGLCISVLEVYQFARDAAVADAWLSAQEPYLLSREYGVGENDWLK